MQKTDLRVVTINLQEGFLVDDKDYVHALFNHNSQSLAWKEGMRREYFNIPANIAEYNDVAVAGHFTAGFWSFKTNSDTNFNGLVVYEQIKEKQTEIFERVGAYGRSTQWEGVFMITTAPDCDELEHNAMLDLCRTQPTGYKINLQMSGVNNEYFDWNIIKTS
jgi:hypothetical protein